MIKKIDTVNGIDIAHIYSDEVIISDAGDALDLIMSVFYDDNCKRITLNKEAIIKEFFILSSGIAGEVLQKVVNYRMKLAIIGDFSGYISEPLKDFMRESNRGRDIFFVATQQEAAEKLTKANP